MAIRAVIFDLGGVLVRTERLEPRQTLAHRLRVDRLALEELVFGGESGDMAQLGQIPADEHWENVCRRLGLPPGAESRFQEEFWGGDELDMILVNTLRDLRLRCKTGLLSNAFSNLRQYLTSVWKISDAFDEIVISSEVGLMKPDLRIYHLALARLGTAPQETVFVDDTERNVIGARQAGLHAIRFYTAEQTLRDLTALLNGRAS